MKIGIIPVCYNAYADAARFLESVEKASCACSHLSLEVVLADNSTVDAPLGIIHRESSFNYTYQKNSNIGYFPAFNSGLSNLSGPTESYDFIIVCNVDLVVADNFFIELTKQSLSENVGVIAPGIFSDKDGRDLNPKMRTRPTRAKINFMRAICSSVLLFRLYHYLVRMKENARSRSQARVSISSEPCKQSSVPSMYGAHGSFMIFTKNYFRRGAHTDYPRFLFGEEGFVAEQLRQHQLLIKHIPVIRVFDKEHASTSQIKLAFICAEHKKSYDYFYTNFLKERS
ncbi:MAG: glycosyltransferase [Proteobacteria bacterium]|nr:MAG: glycosyltransferase [Pseudomonadota bacterium]